MQPLHEARQNCFRRESHNLKLLQTFGFLLWCHANQNFNFPP